MTKTTTAETPSGAPDGGWGWVVVLASFLIHVICDGVGYSYGVFLPDFVTRFDTSHALTGSIGGIIPAVTLGIGPVVSALVNMYGCRNITIAGAIISGIALTITCFADSIYFILVTMGLLLGIGFGLVYIPAIVCASYYFEKKRALATGLAVCGSGVGTLAFPPLTEYLIAEYTWRGAILIHAGVAFNMIIFGLVMRPLPVEKSEQLKIARKAKKAQLENQKMRPESEIKRLISFRETNLDDEIELETSPSGRSAEGSSGGNAGALVPSIERGAMYRKDVLYTGSLQNLRYQKKKTVKFAENIITIPFNTKEKTRRKQSCSERFRDSFREIIDFSILKEPIFVLFVFSNFLTSFGYNVPFIYIKDQGLGLGFDDDTAAFLISGIGIGNTVGRIIFGVIASVPKINKLFVYNVGLILCGACVIVGPFCTTFEILLLCAIMYGFFVGAYVTLTSVLLVDLMSLERLTNAIGLVLLFQGAATVVGAWLCGWIRDITGTYDIPFWIVGAVLTFSGVVLFVIPCMRRCLRKEANNEEIPLSSVNQSDL